MNQNLIQAITLGIALFGAALGLFNAWRSWSQDRVRVRVNVSSGENDNGTRLVVIEVLNVSSFPITVTHIGFNLIGTDRHMQIGRPIFSGSHALPVRLESRTSFTVLQPVDALPAERWSLIRNAYVSTACNLTIKGGHKYFAGNWAALAAKN